ncbi:hypothetical protein OH492_20800 [Vibrio chagasii]|nr:hypothetical protein [Vibrio chagasii]
MNSIAVKIILGLIILSFVFAGVGNYITRVAVTTQQLSWQYEIRSLVSLE